MLGGDEHTLERTAIMTRSIESGKAVTIHLSKSSRRGEAQGSSGIVRQAPVVHWISGSPSYETGNSNFLEKTSNFLVKKSNFGTDIPLRCRTSICFNVHAVFHPLPPYCHRCFCFKKGTSHEVFVFSIAFRYSHRAKPAFSTLITSFLAAAAKPSTLDVLLAAGD